MIERAPLDGIRIVSLAWLGPGPLLSRMLDELGADVVKVEEVAPGHGRREGRSVAADTPGLLPVDPGRRVELGDRGVRRLALDLKSDQGREVFAKLLETCDVVVEGFRPGVATRLGVDYESCRELNESLIHMSISGYGQTGPYRDRPGHDANYLAVGGVLGTTGREGDPPTLPGFPAADHAAGAMSALAHVLTALLQRQRDGIGQHLDVAITDAVVGLMTAFLEESSTTGVVAERGRSAITGLWPWYDVYQTADDRWISVAAIEPWFFAELCRATGLPELVDAQWDASRWDEMRSALRRRFREKSRDDWVQALGEQTCVAPVHDTSEVMADPHVRARGMVVDADHPVHGPVEVVASPVRTAATRYPTPRFAVRAGEHTVEVMTELGFSMTRLDELRRDGVVAWPDPIGGEART